MIAEFERRLADVLGTRLPAPFAGRVRVAPGDVPPAQPAVLLGVTRAQRPPDGVGGLASQLTPGAVAPRRVVRLRCTVGLEVRAATGAGRGQQIDGIDAALYALEAADVGAGGALAGGDDDPGFVIHELRVEEALAPLAPNVAPAGPVSLSLLADGIFWPVGTAGQSGARIGEVRIRGVALPIGVALAAPPVAGGGAIAVTLRVGETGRLALREGQPVASLPFSSLALALRGRGGQAGAGTLQGGAAGAEGARVVTLENGAATVQYVPPAAPATDELVVALADGENGLGVELGRRRVEVLA